MPYEYGFDEALDVVVIRAVGRITEEELLSSFRDITKIREFRPGIGILHDYSSGDLSQLFYEAIWRGKELLQMEHAMFGPGKWAFYVSSNVAFGLARMFVSLSSDIPIEMEIFRDLESARSWLSEIPCGSEQSYDGP